MKFVYTSLLPMHMAKKDYYKYNYGYRNYALCDPKLKISSAFISDSVHTETHNPTPRVLKINSAAFSQINLSIN